MHKEKITHFAMQMELIWPLHLLLPVHIPYADDRCLLLWEFSVTHVAKAIHV